MRRSCPLRVLLFVLILAGGCRSLTEPGERTLTLEVAESRKTCMGMFTYQCLQVRESTDRPFSLFYDSIEGFVYEPGYRYAIEVAVRTIANPPADGSSLAYRLIAVLSKTRVLP